MSELVKELLMIMTKLRDPENGCPWDIEQSFQTIAPYTIEEAYEVVEAIENKDYSNLKEELGDLLLQVVFHTQMAKEQNLFTFDDVVTELTNKLVYRHPHVFGDQIPKNAADVEKIWNEQKQKEKSQSAKDQSFTMDDIPRHVPALMRSQKIQKAAISKGFNWSDIKGVFDKLQEEIDELKEAIAEGHQDHIAEELGDLLFVCGIIGRWVKVDAENALQQSNNKFIKRFNAIEQTLRDQNISLDEASLEQMDEAWNQVKAQEKREAA